MAAYGGRGHTWIHGGLRDRMRVSLRMAVLALVPGPAGAAPRHYHEHAGLGSTSAGMAQWTRRWGSLLKGSLNLHLHRTLAHPGYAGRVH